MCVYSATKYELVMGSNSVADYLYLMTATGVKTLIFLVHTEKISNCKKMNIRYNGQKITCQTLWCHFVINESLSFGRILWQKYTA